MQRLRRGRTHRPSATMLESSTLIFLWLSCSPCSSTILFRRRRTKRILFRSWRYKVLVTWFLAWWSTRGQWRQVSTPPHVCWISCSNIYSSRRHSLSKCALRRCRQRVSWSGTSMSTKASGRLTSRKEAMSTTRCQRHSWAAAPHYQMICASTITCTTTLGAFQVAYYACFASFPLSRCLWLRESCQGAMKRNWRRYSARSRRQESIAKSRGVIWPNNWTNCAIDCS